MMPKAMPSTHGLFEFVTAAPFEGQGLYAKSAQHYSMKTGSTDIMQKITHIAASERSASTQAVRSVLCLLSNAPMLLSQHIIPLAN